MKQEYNHLGDLKVSYDPELGCFVYGTLSGESRKKLKDALKKSSEFEQKLGKIPTLTYQMMRKSVDR